jgi:hypothetical protein
VEFSRDRAHGWGVRPKGGSIAEAGEMGAGTAAVEVTPFRSYGHLLRYISTNLLLATLILDTKKRGVGRRVVRSLFTQFS